MCEIGSATAKNISPMPMPALNIIATHDIVRNSGRSSSRPSRTRPKRLNASTPANTRNAAVESTNSQPNVEMIQLRTSSATTPTPSVSSTPHNTKASEMPAAIENTHGSTPARFMSPSPRSRTDISGVVPLFDAPDKPCSSEREGANAI